MSLSKFSPELNVKSVQTRINKVFGPPLETSIDHDEITQMCCITKKNAVSIELIHHLLGGPNMEYRCIECDESFKAFDFLRGKLIDELKENKKEILFFEDRKCYSKNVIIVVTKQPKEQGKHEHIILKGVIRMTIMVEPKIGFCHMFDITGMFLVS